MSFPSAPLFDSTPAAIAMLEAASFFHSRGWLLGTCGNLSVRLQSDPERLLVSPSGKDKSRLRPEDFLLLDEHGQILQGTGKASEEVGVHQEIYRLSGAGAVFHVHSMFNNLASRLWFESGHVAIEGVEMIKGISGKTLQDRILLPVVANSHDMPTLARSVAAAVSSEVPAVLVYQHGIYAWGRDAEAARRHIEIFEFLLEYAVQLQRRGLNIQGEQGRGIV